MFHEKWDVFGGGWFLLFIKLKLRVLVELNPDVYSLDEFINLYALIVSENLLSE